MSSVISTAPAKCILFGEHAVVYGNPAIAIPVDQLRAKAVVQPVLKGNSGRVIIEAPDIGYRRIFSEKDLSDVFSHTVHLIFDYLQVSSPPSFNLKITSTIPIASGMGSGASIAVATIRAVSNFLGRNLSLEEVSSLAYDVEKLHHGTPSGIDNTVVAYDLPIYYIKHKPFKVLRPTSPLHFLIADSGVRSSTLAVVDQVRKFKESDPAFVEDIFKKIKIITQKARSAIVASEPAQLGKLMSQNHAELKILDVSNPSLDQLVDSALSAGALGAKMTGAGKGGNVVALVAEEQIDHIANALKGAGARSVTPTVLQERTE